MRHGRIRATGYRIGNFAYLTDTNGIPDQSLDLLQGLDTMVVDALRWEPHPTHLSVPEALDLAAELRPRRTFLTHVSHKLEHHATNVRLDGTAQMAYDGLRLEIV
jgi:phosphoribosyl 1,2-cyclic phosphate phosphodiesterase